MSSWLIRDNKGNTDFLSSIVGEDLTQLQEQTSHSKYYQEHFKGLEHILQGYLTANF